MPKKNTQSQDISDLVTNQAVMVSKLGYIEVQVKDINTKLDGEYATKEWCQSHYGQTTIFVNWIIGLLIAGLVSAGLALIFKGGIR